MKRLLALLFVCCVSFAQSFTLEQVMSAPFSDELVAAKSAPRIAWMTNIRGARNIYASDAPSWSPRKLTNYDTDDGQPIAAIAITPDGSTVVYARGTESNAVQRAANPLTLTSAPKQQVWAVGANGGAPKLLGDMGCDEEGCEDIQISPDGRWALWVAKKQLWIAAIDGSAKAAQFTDLRGDASEPQWSPDGRRVAFRLNRETHSFIVIADVQKAAVERYTFVNPSVDRDGSPRWSMDGKHLAFVRRPGAQNRVPLIPMRVTPWAIWIADTNAPTSAPNTSAVPEAATVIGAKELWKSGSGDRDSIPSFLDGGFFATNDRVVFVSEQDNWPHLYSIPLAGGQATLLTPGAYSIEDVTLSRDGKTLFYSSNENDIDRRHVWRVAVGGGAPQALSHGDTMEWRPVETANGEVMALGSSVQLPSLPYDLSADRKAIASTLLPRDFPAEQMIAPKQVVFDSADGFKIHGQLFVPKQCAQMKCPGLIFTHGGPSRQMLLGWHYMYYYANAYAANQYLASRGYVVLSVNYRLGIGYGHDFQYPANASWRGGSEYQDVQAGARYLRALSNVDPQRVGLWGGSYGGYLTAMGLAHDSAVFKAGVDYHGVHDWSVFLPEWEDDAKSAPDLKDAIALAIKSSPVGAADTWTSPVLLIHGDDDRNVPFMQTVDLVQRLRKRNVRIEERIMPDEIHDLLLWRDWVGSYGAMEEFFGRELK